jgi:hypothetical protein
MNQTQSADDVYVAHATSTIAPKPQLLVPLTNRRDTQGEPKISNDTNSLRSRCPRFIDGKHKLIPFRNLCFKE